MQENKSAAIRFIFITLLIDITGIGLIIPVLPELIQQLTGGNISQASKYGGWLTATYSITQFLFSPALGALSDRYGRRPILLLSLLGSGIDYIFMAVAPTLWLVFISRALSGLTGASLTTATAYIADVSTPETNAKNFGLVGAAFGIGFILGPIAGGLLGSIHLRAPFVVAAILCFVNLLYGYFILPESLLKDQRRSFNRQTFIPGKSLLNLKRHPELGSLIGSFSLIYLAAHAIQSNWNYFTIERFGWSKLMIGISLGVVGLLVALVQGLLVRKTQPMLGEEKSIYAGLGLYALGMLLFSVAWQSWMMFAFLIPYCLGGISGPALQSIISQKVPSNEQGEVQGALTSLVSLTSIIGPPLMTNIFSYFTGSKAPFYFPGASFLLGAVFMVIAIWLTYKALHQRVSG